MKFIFHKSFLILILFFSSTFVALAQPPGTLGSIKSNGEGQGLPPPVIQPNDCNVSLPMRVLLANLTSGNNNDYVIPYGHEPMFLEYRVIGEPYDDPGGPIARIPVTSFQYLGHYHNKPVYEFLADSYEVDISTECNRRASDSLYLQISARLVTPDPSDPQGNSYIDYPACKYTSPYGIFSCEVFTYAGTCSGSASTTGLIEKEDGTMIRGDQRPTTDDSLDNSRAKGPTVPGEPCNQEGLIQGNFYYNVHCPESECEYTEDEVGGDNFISNPGGNGSSPNLEGVVVNPNPVSDIMNIQWSEKERLESLRLYRTNGSLVRSWNKNELDASTRLEIQTEMLAQGIYFLEVQALNASKVIKVVKQ